MPSDFSGAKTRLLPPSALSPMRTNSIRDVTADYWFGPLQPVQTVAPASFRPRQWGYQPGANLTWQPKGDSPIQFETLRALASSWDLLRIAIQKKKKQIAGNRFELRMKRMEGEKTTDYKQRGAKDSTLQDLRHFFAKPDGFHRFNAWLKLWLEDMIVIDAVALWMARDRKGQVATIHPIAGDTINRMLTDQGLTPPPGSVAYQQVLYGSPVWDFESTDLVYAMSNEATNRRYGYSYVEQILMTISFGLRRQEWQISEYTSGSVPEALVFLPSDMPLDRVKEAQDWFDSILAGDLHERRRLRFLPGYGSGDQAKPNVVFPKQVLLKDDLDVWLAQVVCACLGISAQPFMRMMNRASAEEANDAAEQEGIRDDVAFVLDTLNNVLDGMGFGGEYEWASEQHADVDPLKAAQAENLLLGKKFTINESREKSGMDPRPEKEADMLGVFSQKDGFLPLAAPADEEKGEDEGEDDEPPPAKTAPANKVSKASRPQARLEKKLAAFLKSTGTKLASRLRKKAAAKAQTSLRKATTWHPEQVLQLLLPFAWTELPEWIAPEIEEMASAASDAALAELVIEDTAVLSEANTIASAWSQERAASLVGMKWSEGELVDNPDAAWAISDTTRDGIRQLVTQAFEQETPLADLADAIEESALFSAKRASTIAKTEALLAQVQGNLAGWRASGVVTHAKWLLSADHDPDAPCGCSELADQGPYGLDEVPLCPAHPNCECVLSPVVNRNRS